MTSNKLKGKGQIFKFANSSSSLYLEAGTENITSSQLKGEKSSLMSGRLTPTFHLVSSPGQTLRALLRNSGVRTAR